MILSRRDAAMPNVAIEHRSPRIRAIKVISIVCYELAFGKKQSPKR